MALAVSHPLSPLVSVLMVTRNGAAHIDAALTSARKQTLAAIEIVVVDDGSTDATPEIIRRHAGQDPRVIPVRGHGRGLAAVRNLSMTAAAAPYAAVLDSDDILHPRHIENLLDLAERTGADLAASNMIAFSEEGVPNRFATGAAWERERLIGHEFFVRAGRLEAEGASLGYFKPLFRLGALERFGLTYDLRLRIGEDWDLVERALAAGLRYAYRPEPTYHYRRHIASTSFRWRREDLAGLVAAERSRSVDDPASTLARARRERLASLENALTHHDVVADLKARRIGSAMSHLLRRPRAARLVGKSVGEGVSRRAARTLTRFRKAGERPTKAPLVVMCGEPAPGSPVALAAALLVASGCTVRRLSRAELADPVATGRAGQGAAVVLVAEERLADAAAHVIGDGAPYVATVGMRHPLIDYFIDSHRFGDVLGLVLAGTLADPGLAWRARNGPIPGLAA